MDVARGDSLMPREVELSKGGEWSAERDVKTGEWRAVRPLPVKKGEYGPVSGVRLVRKLGLPPDASLLDAEREIARQIHAGRLSDD